MTGNHWLALWGGGGGEYSALNHRPIIGEIMSDIGFVGMMAIFALVVFFLRVFILNEDED